MILNHLMLQLVSVEPPPKQGCEVTTTVLSTRTTGVSVEPPPKQGCEEQHMGAQIRAGLRLSGTPAEAGVRGREVEIHFHYC